MKTIYTIIIVTFLIVFIGTWLELTTQRQEALNERHDCAVGMRNETGLTLEQAWDNCGEIEEALKDIKAI